MQMHPLQKLLQSTMALKIANGEYVNVRSYSGRGMYGKTCLAVDGNSFNEVIGSLIDAAMELSNAGEIGSWDRGEIAEAMHNFCHDSMGRGIVVYWPGVPYTSEAESEREAAEDRMARMVDKL